MGKILETRITRFDGGISDDPREEFFSSASLVKHFDIYSNPRKLTPYRSTETDIASDMKQYDVKDFQLGLDGKLYGLGKESNGFPKIVSKADPTTGSWTLNSNAEGNAARISGSFIEWQNAWWFFQGTNQVSKFVIGGSITNSVSTVGSTITTVAQSVIGADDNLYMFYNNVVVRVSPAGSVTDDVISAIPSDMRITSVARWGTYLAIGCAYGTSATATPSGRSQVFLWDMVTTTTVSDVIDWGDGALQVLGNIEGRIVGVSDKFLSSSLGITRGSMVVRMWAGAIPKVFKEVVANQTVTLGRFIRNVVIKADKMYWVASVPFELSTSTESTFHLGIWCFGRKNRNSEFALSLDYIEDGIDSSNFKINSFGNAGNYWFINHSADGSISKTDDAGNFTTTSLYDTQILGNAKQVKKLIVVGVETDYMPSAGQVVVKYRKDEETSYTTIFTHTVDNSLNHEAINIESSGDDLPEYREIQIRVESTGGAEITGIYIKHEEIAKNLTD